MSLCECGEAPAIEYDDLGSGYCAKCLYSAREDAIQRMGIQVMIDALRATAGVPRLLAICPVCETMGHDESEARLAECAELANAFCQPADPSEIVEQLEEWGRMKSRQWN